MLASFISLIFFILLFPESTRAQNITINVHLRGVYESKISLLPLVGENAFKSIAIVENVKNDGVTTIQVSKEYLPGEFVLRFDYKENLESTPYPAEKRIIINDQHLDLWMNPIFSNNPDSTWFQEDERENTTYSEFLLENEKQKRTLGLLQNFLLNYDDANSSFYNEGKNEYERRRKAFNLWITEQTKLHKELYVCNFFCFEYVPKIHWEGSETVRKQSLRDNYFEKMNFGEPLILSTTKMKEWMDGYVNLYGVLATDITLRDSLFVSAGRNAIEKARDGHPLVYGWMVDYFFKGYESFNIEKGIKILETYLNDPNCLTSKRQAINLRLMGMETLIPGTIAPNIIQEMGNMHFELYTYQTIKPHIILLFWSANCNHCTETVQELYLIQQHPEQQQRLDIVAISMDETDIEILVWQKKMKELIGWTHLRPMKGIGSKVAEDYFILAVPVMILIDASTKEIIALPDGTEQLTEILKFH